MDECLKVHEIVDSERCEWVKNEFSCSQEPRFVDYIPFLYCRFSGSMMVFGCILLGLVIVLLFIILATTTDEFFCYSLEKISAMLRLSENVAGVTVLAFGNGSPNIFTSCAGVMSGHSELVFGEMLGSGMLISSILVGIICMMKPFQMLGRAFLRDISFFIMGVLFIYFVFYKGYSTLLESAGFLILYVFYLVVVLSERMIRRSIVDLSPEQQKALATLHFNLNSTAADDEEDSDEDDEESVKLALSGKEYTRNIVRRTLPDLLLSVGSKERKKLKNLQRISVAPSPPFISYSESDEKSAADFKRTMLSDFLQAMNPIKEEEWEESSLIYKFILLIIAPISLSLRLLIPVVKPRDPDEGWCKPLYVLHCITQPLYISLATGYGYQKAFLGIPNFVPILILGMTAATAVYCTSELTERPFYSPVFLILTTIGSIYTIFLAAEEMVKIMRALGVVLQISETTLGLSVLAWGNSLPDIVSILSLVRAGYPRMGMAACFGCPLFNTLTGIGLAFVITTVKSGVSWMPGTYGAKGPVCLIFLLLSLISSLVVFTSLRFNVDRCFGIYLLCLYACFIFTILLFEFRIISL